MIQLEVQELSTVSGHIKLSPPPPSFRASDLGEGSARGGVVWVRTPKSAISRAKTARYPKISAKMALLGGRARRRRKILAFWGPLKCDSLRGKRSKKGPKSGKIPHLSHPPFFSDDLGQKGGGGSVLYVLIDQFPST